MLPEGTKQKEGDGKCVHWEALRNDKDGWLVVINGGCPLQYLIDRVGWCWVH
jgi:hypothetical protein